MISMTAVVPIVRSSTALRLSNTRSPTGTEQQRPDQGDVARIPCVRDRCRFKLVPMGGAEGAADRIREIRLATFGSSEQAEAPSSDRDSGAKLPNDDETPTISDAEPESEETASELLASQGRLIGVLLDRLRTLEQRVSELENVLSSEPQAD